MSFHGLASSVFFLLWASMKSQWEGKALGVRMSAELPDTL
jgi:hypothetical protein